MATDNRLKCSFQYFSFRIESVDHQVFLIKSFSCDNFCFCTQQKRLQEEDDEGKKRQVKKWAVFEGAQNRTKTFSIYNSQSEQRRSMGWAEPTRGSCCLHLKKIQTYSHRSIVTQRLIRNRKVCPFFFPLHWTRIANQVAVAAQFWLLNFYWYCVFGSIRNSLFVCLIFVFWREDGKKTFQVNDSLFCLLHPKNSTQIINTEPYQYAKIFIFSVYTPHEFNWCRWIRGTAAVRAHTHTQTHTHSPIASFQCIWKVNKLWLHQ